MAVSLSDIKDVVSLASSVVKLGEGYYRSSIALEEFKSNVAKLKSTYVTWERRAREYGLSSERTLHLSLKEAEERLQREEARLKDMDKRCGCLCLCLFCGTDFPAQLGKSIVNLDDTIPSHWKVDDGVEIAARKRAEDAARLPKFRFKRDPRYIRLPVIENELKNILNDQGSGDETIRVVLLYGRAGTGKSSMARNLALDYEQAAISEADGCASSSAYGCREFDNVLYVECGPEADFKAKQRELLGMLRGMLRWKGSSDTEKDHIEEKFILKQLLKDRHSLIILDDVWEGSFLKNMVEVCGQHMKILVTSQKTFLCEDFLYERTKSIPMDPITREDSLKILKAHTGFGDEDDIPEDVKKRMDDLVTKTCGHPHALASIAAVAIDARHRKRLLDWENANVEYDQLLNNPRSKESMKPLHDVQYERSYTEAIQMKFNGRLGEEETKLLILMVILQGPSIAEEILLLFYGEIIVLDKSDGVRSSSRFSGVRKRLEDLQCIKTGEYEGMLSWSIHSLDEQFIQRWMNDDIIKMLEVVKCLPNKIQGLEAEPQVHAIKLLGYVFFKSAWAKDIIASNDKSPEASRSRLLEVILPVICLMAKTVGEDWNLISQKSSDQIFLSFLSEGVIHKDAAKNLLNSSTSKHQMWTLISSSTIRRHRDWSIDEDLIIGALRIFGHLELSMDNSDCVLLNVEQCNALVKLVQAYAKNARSCLFQMRKLVSGLIEMLTSSCCAWNIKHFSAALVLSYLVPLMHDRSFEYGRKGSAITPMIIGRLLSSFQESDVRSVHERAAHALFDLAQDSIFDVKQEIISTGFDQLVDNLKGDRNIDGLSQAFALLTLKCLCVEQFETGSDYKYQLSASMIQDLSNCLADLIARRPEERGIFLKRDSPVGVRETVRFLCLDQEGVVQLLMRIDPARGKSMMLLSAGEFEARGSELVRLGQYQDGVSDLKKARERDPQHFVSFEELMIARAELEDWESAIEDCDHEKRDVGASKSSRTWGLFYLWRGRVKHDMGNLPGALEDFDQSLRSDPDNLEVLMERSYTKLRMGDEDAARTDVKEEAFHNKCDSHYRNGLSKKAFLKRMLGDFSGALKDLDESLQLFPYDYPALVKRGHVKFLMDDKEGARADAEEDPFGSRFDDYVSSNYEAFFNLTSVRLRVSFYQERGVLKRLLGDLPGALDDLDKSLQLDPNDYEVLKYRGYLNFLMGDKEGAQVDGKEALRFKPRRGYENDCLEDSHPSLGIFRGNSLNTVTSTMISSIPGVLCFECPTRDFTIIC